MSNAKRIESAALDLIACPVGGWPETEQARRRFDDVAGRYVVRGGRHVVVAPDPVAVARRALARGAERPARASEWEL